MTDKKTESNQLEEGRVHHKKKSELSAWRKVMDGKQIRRSVTRIAHEIVERNKGVQALAIVGVRTRGEWLANRLSQALKEIENTEVPMGVVDITLYRDDIADSSDQPLVRGTSLPFNLNNFTVILVDDVLFTGRTVRAALDAMIDFGRPKAVHLAVLVDRGHRELPIRADYIGKSLPTSKIEVVEVCLEEVDDDEGVFIRSDEQ